MADTFRPYEGTDPYIFVSYSSKDQEQVLRIAGAAREAGYRVWWDEGIHVSDEITDGIVEHIERCAVFLLFLSDASCGSDWCWKEFRYAQDEKRPIAAVRIDPDLDLDRHRRFKFHLRDIHIDQSAPGDDLTAFVARLGQEAVFASCKGDGETTDAGTAPGTGWHPIEGSTIHWRLDRDGVLTIARNEAFPAWMKTTPIPDYEWDRERGRITAPWMDLREEIRSVVIRDDIAAIGDRAFGGCVDLTRVTLPNSVTSIGAYAFHGCTGLTRVTISNSVTSIGAYAFHGCKGLTRVTIPNSVTTIGKGAFYGCTGLTRVTIPDSVTSIGAYAFHGCKGLMSVTIPDSMTFINGWAFHGCAGLTSVTIPDSVTTIGDGAFHGCKGLTSVTISNSVITIGAFAFEGCTDLTSVTIPDSVTTIGNYAFYGCTDLTNVTIGDSVTSIGASAFDGCNKRMKSVTIPARAKLSNKAFPRRVRIIRRPPRGEGS